MMHTDSIDNLKSISRYESKILHSMPSSLQVEYHGWEETMNTYPTDFAYYAGRYHPKI
jgi:hypothetical protein